MLLIKNGLVHDGLGRVETMDIAVADGKIVALGSALPAADRVIDAAGAEVFPGFVNALSYWGIFGPGWTGHDHSELSDPVTPALDVTYAFDHDGMNFQHVYTYGVTTAGVMPLPSNVFAGQAAVYKTYGRSPHAMLVKDRAAMIASVSSRVKSAYEGRHVMPMTKMGAFSLLLDNLTKAARLDDKGLADDRNAAALRRVVDGELPLFLNCAGKAEIEAVLSALKSFEKLRLVLTGAYGIDSSMPALFGREVAVVLGDQTEAMNRHSHISDSAAVKQLIDSGIDVAIGCAGDDYTAGRESLLWNAIYWHRHGLEQERCLCAITSLPAKLLGVADRVGAIKVGLDADLSIWTKNPLCRYDAVLTHVMIDGEDVLKKEAYASCW